ELLKRNKEDAAEVGLTVASNSKLTLAARVAGMYTYAQAAQEDAIPKLVKLTKNKNLREYALRALTDRKSFLDEVPNEPFISALQDSSARIKAAAIIGLNRLGKQEAASALLKIKVPDSFKPVPEGEIGPHATPNPAIILPHLAAQALANLHAVKACINAIGTKESKLALWALRYMHDTDAVSGMIAAFNNTTNEDLKREIIHTLARIYHKEAAYDGSWWWGTRPDTHGPYYKGIPWEGSSKIKDFFIQVAQNNSSFDQTFFETLNEKFRLRIKEFGGKGESLLSKMQTQPKVNFGEIINKKGEVGKNSIENVLIALQKIKGDPSKGKQIFAQQGCMTCHSIKKGVKLKGPFLGQIGGIMNKEQIAESILKPSASISQGFPTTIVNTKAGKAYVGFIVAQSARRIVIRDITGATHLIKTNDISKQKEVKASSMPVGLANSLSYKEFASLVTYLYEQKK
ncbi:MAG TPA: hypothetical protein VK084_09305, partial [Chitinophagaceae bacterium]|nr:hypothetical protein [Chitinophagaceae bacterium]